MDGAQGSHSIPRPIANDIQNLSSLQNEKSEIDQKINHMTKTIQDLNTQIKERETQPEFAKDLKVQKWEVSARKKQLTELKSKQLELAKKISTQSGKININSENIDQVLQDLGVPKKQTPVKDKGKEKAEQSLERQKININRENIDQVLQDLEDTNERSEEAELKPIDLLAGKKDLSLLQPTVLAKTAANAENLRIKDLLQKLSGTLNTNYANLYDSSAEKNPADELAYKINADVKNIVVQSGLIPNTDKIQESKALRSIIKSLNSTQTFVSNFVARNNADPKFVNKIDKLKTDFLKDLKKEIDAKGDIPVKQPFNGIPETEIKSKIKNTINTFKESENQFNGILNNLIQEFRGMEDRFGRMDKKYLKEAIDILENHRKISSSLLRNLENIDKTDAIDEKMTMFLSEIKDKAINDFLDQQDNIMNWLDTRYFPQEKRFSKLAKNFAKKHPELLKEGTKNPLEYYANKFTENLSNISTHRRVYKLSLDQMEKYSETMSDEAQEQIAHLCTLIDLRNALGA